MHIANKAVKMKLTWNARIVMQADKPSPQDFTILNTYPIA